MLSVELFAALYLCDEIENRFQIILILNQHHTIYAVSVGFAYNEKHRDNDIHTHTHREKKTKKKKRNLNKFFIEYVDRFRVFVLSIEFY